MDDKELEEFKKWEYAKRQEEIDKYGIELSKIDRKKATKKFLKYARIIKRIGRFIKASAITFFVIVAIAILLFLYILYSRINERVNVNVREALEGTYDIKIKILKQETEGRVDNGRYYIETKNSNPQIKFTAVKWYGGLNDDYLDNITKYFFDLWNSPSKKYFVANEGIDKDGLLDYELYVDNYSSIDEATNAFIDFVDFCGDSYKGYWQVYIKIYDSRIYPYTGSNTTREQAIENVKRMYENYLKFIGKPIDNAINTNSTIPAN